MVQAAGCKVRKDSVMMVETLITASPEFMNSLPPEEQKAYLTEAMGFISLAVFEWRRSVIIPEKWIRYNKFRKLKSS